MIEAFERYVTKFEHIMDKIIGKVEHTKRVAVNSIRIAKSLNLNEDDIKIAETIGYLHDISRFEQMQKYDTYIDKNSFDHGDYACKLLFEDNLIKDYPVNPSDYDLIEFAIRNHNKLSIGETSDERKKLHAKIIRDADKLDIFLRLKNGDSEIEEKGDKLSSKVKEFFYTGRCVDRTYVETRSDAILTIIAFYCYDLNFSESYKMLKELNIIEVFKNLLPKGEEFEEILDIANKYIKERIDENVG